METIFEYFYIKTVGVSLLIALILLARPLVLRKMNAKLAYQMWLIIPIFLLLPVQDFSEVQGSNQLTVYLEQNQALPTLPAVTESASPDLISVSMVVWLVGFLASLFVYFQGYRKLKNSLRFSTFQPNARMVKQFNQNRNVSPNFVESNLVNTPAVFGFLNANIILPRDFTNQEIHQQNVILGHEFFHVLRRDYQINHLRNLVRCVFWFNPLVYIADKYFEADQEMSCDLGVLETTKSISHKHYATVLLNEAITENRTTLLSQWNYSVLIKERIKMIGKNQNKLWHKWLTAIFAIASVGYANLLVAGNKTEKSEAIPLVVIQPDYPRAAAENNIEGLVKFQFDLTDDGKPANLSILNSEPAGVFDQVALKAIKKWKFKPDVHAKEGLVYTLEFKLSEPNHAIPTNVIAPMYPRKAALDGIQGEVTFSFDLKENGKPTNLKVTRSEPEGVFDKAAEKAIKKWKFKSKSGENKDLQYTMEFRLHSETSNSVNDLESLKKEYAEFKKARAEALESKEKHEKNGDKKLLESMDTYIAQLDKLIESIEFEIAASSK